MFRDPDELKDIKPLKMTASKLPPSLRDTLLAKDDYVEIREYFFLTDLMIDFLKNMKKEEKGEAGVWGFVAMLIIAAIATVLVSLFFLRWENG